MAGGKLRASCDRCHLQKLKCARQSEQQSCQRCSRLGTICRFSARTSRTTTRKVSERWRSRATHADDAIAADVSLLDGGEDASSWIVPNPSRGSVSPASPDATDLGVLLPMGDKAWPGQLIMPPVDGLDPSESLQFTDLACAAAEDLMSNETELWNPTQLELICPLTDVNAGLRDPPVESMASKLANVSVVLSDFAGRLTALSAAGPRTPTRQSSKEAALIILDELFRVTADFTDAVRNSCPRPLSWGVQPGLGQQEPSYIHDEREEDVQRSSSPGGRTPPTNITTAGGPETDESTLLMLLSCHTRLTEIYTSIFHRMRHCIAAKSIPMTSTTTTTTTAGDWAMVLPPVHIGSCLAAPTLLVDAANPVPRASASVYMCAVAMMTARLWGQLAEVMGVDCTSGGGGGQRGDRRGERTAAVDAVWDLAVERTGRFVGTVEEVQRSLLLI